MDIINWSGGGLSHCGIEGLLCTYIAPQIIQKRQFVFGCCRAVWLTIRVRSDQGGEHTKVAEYMLLKIQVWTEEV